LQQRASMDGRDIEQRSVGELLSLVTNRAPADLLERAGGLERLSRADALEIASHLTPQRARVAREAARAVAAAFELGRRVEIARNERPQRLTSPEDVATWARPRLATLAHEELWMLGVDGRGHLRAARCIAKGGLHGAAVRPADPLRAALRIDATAFVLVHNHPSGDPTPSREDERFTAQIAAAAKVVGLALLDHVVVARDGFSCVAVADS
jgi:DNA repair protein RadC